MSEVPLYPTSQNIHRWKGGLTCRLLRKGLPYRGTSLIRNRLLLGPYSSSVSRGLGWS